LVSANGPSVTESLPLRMRTVVAVLHRLQASDAEAVAALADFRVIGDAVFVGQFVQSFFIEVHEAQILHHILPFKGA